jgi:hypothetical protein
MPLPGVGWTTPKTWWAPGGVPPSALQLNVSQSISRVLEGMQIDDPHARRPFLLDAGCPTSPATYPDGESGL